VTWIGFEKNIGCGPGVFLVQNDYFVSRGIALSMLPPLMPVVNHKVLFQKLFSRGAPSCFIGTLCNWYSKLLCTLEWCSEFSFSCQVWC